MTALKGRFIFGITLLDPEQEGSVRGKTLSHSLKTMKALLAASLIVLPAFIGGGEAKAISHYNTNKILNYVSTPNIETILGNTSPSYISADESIRNKINDINDYKSRYHI